jgi:hypothetical protein
MINEHDIPTSRDPDEHEIMSELADALKAQGRHITQLCDRGNNTARAVRSDVPSAKAFTATKLTLN